MAEYGKTKMKSLADQWNSAAKGDPEVRIRQEILTRLIEKKFGSVTSEARGRIRIGSKDSLDECLDRLLEATTVDQVFGF
ncbi:MAG: hypothetical protein ACE366_21620 [Bradymonadia bacterium]